MTYADFEAGGGSFVVKAMKKKFDEWRKIASEGRPVLVFWDEIDSMGARGRNAHNDSYWAAIINAMLDFLDGAHPRDGIVVVAATNHVDRVDPALLRAGRLDRHVEMSAPTIEALANVIAYHLSVDAKHADTIAAAKAMRGASPADIALACRETRRMGRMLSRVADAADLVDLVAWSRGRGRRSIRARLG